MLKRLRWLTLGAGLGAGVSLWVRRRLRALADRYAPVRGTVTALGAARRMRRDLAESWRDQRQRASAAWDDGRHQMRRTEQRLRDEREHRWAERRRRRQAA